MVPIKRAVIANNSNQSVAAHQYPPAPNALQHGQRLCVQGTVTNATWRVFATLEDAADGATPNFVDITQAGYSLSNNSFGNATFGNSSGSKSEIVDFGHLPIHQWYVLSTCANASNAERFTFKSYS